MCISFRISFSLLVKRRKLGESQLTYEKLQRNLRRLRNNKYPKTPRCPQDIIEAFEKQEIMNDYGFNLRKTKLFYLDTVNVKAKAYFTIFVSYEAVDLIKKYMPENRNYLLDGTFKVAPIGGFYQLLIIHIQCNYDVSGLITTNVIDLLRYLYVNYSRLIVDNSSFLCANDWQEYGIIFVGF